MSVDLKTNQYLVRGSRGDTRETSMDNAQVLLDPSGNALQAIVRTNRSPTSADDADSTYKVDVGMRWYDTSTGVLYECTSALAGAATWALASGGGSSKHTTGILHIYADWDNGDDDNAGYTFATAKKTLAAAAALITDYLEAVVILHISGNHVIPESIVAIANKLAGVVATSAVTPGRLILTGVDDVQIVDDNSGADYTATSITTESVTLTGAGWTVDEHIGSMVELTAGDGSGTLRGVLYNTEDTVFFCRDLTAAPATADFRFVRPKTTLTFTAATYGGRLDFSAIVGQDANNVMIQRLHFVDGGIALHNCTGAFRFNAITAIEVSRSVENFLYTGTNGPNIEIITIGNDPETGEQLQGDTVRWVRSCGITARMGIKLKGCDNIYLYACSFTEEVNVSRSHMNYGKAAAPNFVFESVIAPGTLLAEFTARGGVANCFDFYGCDFGAAGIALSASNSSGDAIVVDKSKLIFATLVGSTNVGFALYVKELSSVQLTAQPTISATAGDTTLDGTNLASTFANIEGGAPAVGLQTASLIRNADVIAVADASGAIGGGGGGMLGETVDVVDASGAASAFANGLSYVTLAQGADDTLVLEFIAAKTTTIELELLYAMSAANAGDLELKADYLALGEGDDPTTAITAQAAFVVTPGNDVLLHAVNGDDSATMEFAVTIGDSVYVKITRPSAGNDTHTADMRVTRVRVKEA